MADMPWEHAAEARAALNAIVTDPEHGVAALSSPRTMSNLLKDLLPDAPREKNLLVAAAEAGLADKLRGHVAEGMDSSTAIRLTASTFSDSTPLTPDACSWVAGEIAVALGISTPAELGSAGTAAAGAGQIGTAQSAGSGPGGYASEAPTREHVRPPVQGFDSAGAQGSGQIPAQMPSQSSPEQASHGFPQGSQGFGSGSDPGYPETPAQSYPQGSVASFQQPADYPQPAPVTRSPVTRSPVTRSPVTRSPASSRARPPGRGPAGTPARRRTVWRLPR